MPCENNARKRSKTMAFRCTPEEHKLICEMAAWSGMSRQNYIIAKLTDTKVDVRPSVSVQKALRGSMTELAKEVRLGGLLRRAERVPAAMHQASDGVFPGARRASQCLYEGSAANEGVPKRGGGA